MEVVSLLKLLEGDHVGQVDLVIWGEVLHQVLAGALIVVLMDTGLETARLGTGRTSVTAVGIVAMLKETAKAVPRN